MRVVTSKQMKTVERNSLQYDLTFHRLMENAGAAAAAFIRRTFRVESRNCIIFCSKGNNGGDGFVVARKLAENGVNVLVALLDGKPASEEAKAMYTQLEMMEVPILDFAENADKLQRWLAQTDFVVDAICGTGFRGELRENHRAACRMINDTAAAVISLDLPTGVECDSGIAAAGAVQADFTLAFDSLKPAHFMPSSQGMCGTVEVLNIGIPDEARAGIDYRFGSLSAAQVFEKIPPRAIDSHKGNYGRLLNIAGSLRYRGAAILSTLAALRCGAGLVTLASIEPVCAAAALSAPEAILLPLEGEECPDSLISALGTSSSVLFGCGMGNTERTAKLLAATFRRAGGPVVVDADGLNALAENIHLLKEASIPLVLTPHPGEMARLCGLSVAQVQADRHGTALRFAALHDVTVVLKGHRTLIASPDGGLIVNETGGPGLAKGGSGDVLAGMIASLLAQGLGPRAAATCGAFLHGMAADRTALRLSQTAMLPRDILDDLTGVFAEYQR